MQKSGGVKPRDLHDASKGAIDVDNDCFLLLRVGLPSSCAKWLMLRELKR